MVSVWPTWISSITRCVRKDNAMNQPVISIITVTFNAANVVEKTIQSVVSQTYDKLEYLIIDGASKDNTMAVVDHYRGQIERHGRIVSEPDKGLYDAMNKGASLATGDWVLFMNADEVFVDELVLTDVASFIEAHPEADAICGDALMIYEYGTFPNVSKPEDLPHRMSVFHQSTFVRTSLLREHPFDTHYRYAADYEQLSSLALAGHKFLHIDRKIAMLEMRSGTTYENMLDSAREHYSILEARGMDIEAERKKMFRHKKIVISFKKYLPNFLSQPILRLIARYYKPL